MDHPELNAWSKRAADWITDYHASLRDRPVRARVEPGALAAALPATAPEEPEPMAAVWEDFQRLVPGAMTHWQHPRFFAYFPANAAPASMLAEQVVNGMAAQAMLWQTAPAAAEMEEVVVGWLRDALGLPEGMRGTIHDTATTCTLAAVLTMRERALAWAGLRDGLSGAPRLRLYASGENHSSVDKAARIAGIGQENLVKVATGDDLAMRTDLLDRAIRDDLAAGYLPIGVVLSVGGTSVGAIDRIGESIAVAKAHGLTSHVDAAWAGSAMICPEFRHLWAGVEAADSIVFNPHKWLGAQFDCTVQFLADPTEQVRTLGLRPEFLKTLGRDEITNFNEWTVPLGRRFRALKLWFLLRTEGLSGLRTRIRNHVAWAADAAKAVAAIPGCEVVTGPVLGLFTFRYRGDAETEALLAAINDDGRLYLTQTRHRGKFLIRVSVGQFDCTAADVAMIPAVIAELTGGA